MLCSSFLTIATLGDALACLGPACRTWEPFGWRVALALWQPPFLITHPTASSGLPHVLRDPYPHLSSYCLPPGMEGDLAQSPLRVFTPKAQRGALVNTSLLSHTPSSAVTPPREHLVFDIRTKNIWQSQRFSKAHSWWNGFALSPLVLLFKFQVSVWGASWSQEIRPQTVSPLSSRDKVV